MACGGFDMESGLGCEKQRQVRGNEDLRAFGANRPSQSGKHPVALGNTNEVLRRFDSETGWVAAGLVSFAIIAALALAVDVGREDATDNVTKEKLAGDDGLLNASPGALPYVGSVNSESASEISSGQTFSTDPTGSLSSPRQNHPQGMESQEPIQTPVPTLTSANRTDAQSNSKPVSSVHRGTLLGDPTKDPQFNVTKANSN
jgi:hypothetical protein